VKHRVVLGVLNLAMKTLDIVRGKHTKKTAAFVRACLAYCYITIPAMEDFFSRLNLYLLSANVAMINGSLPQGEGFLKAAITLVQEIPAVIDTEGQVRSTEEPLFVFYQNFFSILVVLPGHPEHGPFYLIKGLLKVVKDYPWEKGSVGKTRVLVQLLAVYASYYQTSLPYHIDKLDSNDVLYASDSDFQEELMQSTNKLVEEILEDVTAIKDDPDVIIQKKIARVALDLFNVTLGFAELNAKSATLLVNLFTTAKKLLSNSPDAPYLKNTLSTVETHPSKLAQDLYRKLKTL